MPTCVEPRGDSPLSEEKRGPPWQVNPSVVGPSTMRGRLPTPRVNETPLCSPKVVVPSWTSRSAHSPTRHRPADVASSHHQYHSDAAAAAADPYVPTPSPPMPLASNAPHAVRVKPPPNPTHSLAVPSERRLGLRNASIVSNLSNPLSLCRSPSAAAGFPLVCARNACRLRPVAYSLSLSGCRSPSRLPGSSLCYFAGIVAAGLTSERQ